MISIGTLNSWHSAVSTALCILLYSGVSTYVGLYGSGLFNFGSYVSLPTLFACFLGFDIPTSFILLKMFFLLFLLLLYHSPV